VEPPSGLSGKEVLLNLAKAFGVNVSDDLSLEIDEIINRNLIEEAAFYWNTGQERKYVRELRLLAVGSDVKAGSIQPPLTHGEQYKREIRDVGTDRYRVRKANIHR
jgi:hypothetical protein